MTMTLFYSCVILNSPDVFIITQVDNGGIKGLQMDI